MSHKRVFFCLLLVALSATWGKVLAAAGRPNIVVVMADDMGYSDLGCYGGEMATPNVDRLAAAGLRFTHFYNNDMCVPTRASLLTGVYHTTALRDHRINQRCVTIAEVLAGQGYHTAMSGKWHLSQPEYRPGWPRQRGFDRYFGTINGASSFFAPASLMRDNAPAEQEYEEPGFYYTNAISDNAVQYVQDIAGGDAPLFLYVAYTSPHWPLHALETDVARNKGRYDMGWDELRRQRHARMKQLGVVDSSWLLSPRDPDVPAWEDEPHKAWQARRMEVYAAQIECMDRGIGRIVDALKRTGRLNNTLLMFLIDNGGCHVEYTPDRKGPYLPEMTRDGRPVRPGNLPSIMPGPEDTYQSYGRGWANASNTPFRLFKKYAHEGGILTPLVVHWPEVIQSGGALTDQVGHVIDILPTCLAAAGADYPSQRQGVELYPADGKSLLPVLHGDRRGGHEEIYWKWAEGKAVRQGKWKLVAVRRGEWELYDMETDRTELDDLASRMPAKVAELSTRFDAWEQRTEALP